MKLFIVTLALVGFMQIATPGHAQVNVQVNIGAQPQWGPPGYRYAEYYYLPDIDVYYNVPQRQFVYLEGRRWAFAGSLPIRYRSYDLYRGRKVVINDRAPYQRCDYYRDRYRHDNGRHNGKWKHHH
jgi:hypothetical protein